MWKRVVRCCLATVISTQIAGSEIGEFSLQTPDGDRWESQREITDPYLVVCFLGTECPMARMYAERLNELAERYHTAGVAFVGVDANQQDSLEDIREFIQSHKLAFPLLKDERNRVADQFGAERTPEVFVLDAERRVVYHGAIDDQYDVGTRREAPRQEYLREALDALTERASNAATVRAYRRSTPVTGCLIGRMKVDRTTAEVTYCNQISRLLNQHCVSCHRDGEIGPFALDAYEEAVGWAAMIDEVVQEGRMPPWHADAAEGTFSNDVRLSSKDKQLIADWASAGAPQGDLSELPDPPVFRKGWQMGEPDLVIAMDTKPFVVPATGTVPYQYFVVDPKFTEDRWIGAAECRPGNRAVVHHIIVGIEGEGDFGDRRRDPLQSEWLVATAPGAPPMRLPPGYGKRIPAGAKLIFQLHYTPVGTVQSDLSCVGLRFVNEETVEKQVATWMAYNDRFRIPAGAGDHRVEATRTIRQTAELLTMFPHMHYRGKSFTYEFAFPSGETRRLLQVPHYDFNWQNSYDLVKPIMLPRGTKLTCVATFDNSDKNRANPDPNVEVTWGDQTWEEMMIGYFDVAFARDSHSTENREN